MAKRIRKTATTTVIDNKNVKTKKLKQNNDKINNNNNNNNEKKIGRGRGKISSKKTSSTTLTEKLSTNELQQNVKNKKAKTESSNNNNNKMKKLINDEKQLIVENDKKISTTTTNNNKKSSFNNSNNNNNNKTKPKKAQKISKQTTTTTTAKRGRKPKLKDDNNDNTTKNTKKKLNKPKVTKKNVLYNDNDNDNDDNVNIKEKNKEQEEEEEENDDTEDDDIYMESDNIVMKSSNIIDENIIDNNNNDNNKDNNNNNNNNSTITSIKSPSSTHHFSKEQNFLGTLYNNNNNANLISSSSTSAFSTVSTTATLLHSNQYGTNYLTSSLTDYNTTTKTTNSSPLQHHNINSIIPITAVATTTTSTSTSLSSLSSSSFSNIPTTPTGPVPQLTSQQQQNILHGHHQSLLSPPQNQNNTSTNIMNDPAHDLPNELLQQGWRKIWSKREARFYFYNKNTNQSIWEMPKLSNNLFDPMTDPLGIQSANNPLSINHFQPAIHSDHVAPPIYQTLNPAFTPFAQNKNDIMSNDKKTMIGPFDFEIEPNCYIWEGSFFYYFHPHPDVELARFNFVHKLRQQYWELCRTRQTIDPPKDSFTKWILERKIIDKGCDPILPSECANELSTSLYREIINDIPIKLFRPKFSGEARKQLSKYAEASKKIIEAHHVSSQSRKIVKWNVEDAFDWIRRTLNPKFEDYIERLEHLKKQCQPHIIDAAKSSVEAICLKIYHVASDYARRIREMNLEFAKKEDLREFSVRMNNKKIPCYPAYLMYPCPKLPPTLMMTEKDSVILRCGKNAEVLRLNIGYLQKLEMLYYFNCRDDRKYNYFLTRVWCLLKRYQCFYDKNEGFFSQNSLPLSVFVALNKHFGVTFECFSSPLNCYFRQYCSIFPDTDGYFGSRGSILNFYPISGSFQANPPDSEDLINATITHFEKLLENSMEPLSFIIFIQEKPDISEKLINRLESNKFKRMHLIIQSTEHEYRHGFQHICNQNEIYIKSIYNTIVYFLQNDSGFLKWGPTPERVEELVESFKIDRDKELTIILPSFTSSSTNVNSTQQQQSNSQQQQQSSSSSSSSSLKSADIEIRPNGI